uniref:AXH domain-containing protein n=1 Tax=Anopheles epiroticus TaxID=199890 RepID=A0A182PT71_9DIPT
MLSAVENLGSSGPGRVPYPRHHPHQLPHQHPAQHHPYHPLHTILSPTSLSQLQLPPLLGAQTTLPHPMASVANEFVRPYPKQRYDDNRGFGIPSALTAERRLKYGDPPPPAPVSGAPTHTQTGPVNLAVSNGGAGTTGGSAGTEGRGGGGEEFVCGAPTYPPHCPQPSNPQEVGAPRFSPGNIQKYQQDQQQQQQQQQQMLDFLGAQQQQQQQQQTNGNRMLCFPPMPSLDVFGGFPALNYDMYPYSRVHGRSNFLPNQRPLESRYTSASAAAAAAAAAAAPFLPPRPPPPDATGGGSGGSGSVRLPKPAAAPIGIKPNRWLMPSTAPPPAAAPTTLSSAQHTAAREMALAVAAASNTAPLNPAVDSLVASYRALNTAHHLQHGYHRLWAPPTAPEPMRQPQQTAAAAAAAAAAAYLAELPTIGGEEEKGLAGTPYHPSLLSHGASMNHISASLQDSYIASLQRHRPKYATGGAVPCSTATSTSQQPAVAAATAGSVQPEFKVPIGMEAAAQKSQQQQQQQQQQARAGLVRAEPQIAIGPGPSYAIGLGDGEPSCSRRSQYATEAHELPDDAGAQQQILHTTVVKPKMFLRGSMISFQNGVKKPVEEVRLEDFLRTAAISPDVRLTEAQTRRITPRYSSAAGETVKKILVRFTYDQEQRHGALETTVDYPFFVTTKGWASYSPERTFANYGLECAPMELGDVFIVLVPRHLASESLLQLEDDLLSPEESEPIPRLIVPSAPPPPAVDEKLRIVNVFSICPSGTLPEENAAAGHRQQQHQQLRKPSTGEEQEGPTSPLIMIDEEPSMSRHWMTGTSSSRPPAASSTPVAPGKSGRGSKRRHEGPRRGSAKRKLTELQGSDVFRQGAAPAANSTTTTTTDTNRRDASTDAME